MNTNNDSQQPSYKVIESSYGDPLLKRKGLNDFQRRPSRSEWIEFEVREYPCGTHPEVWFQYLERAARAARRCEPVTQED